MTIARRFQLSPLIRFTLLAVYLALVVPLPLLAPVELRAWLLIASIAGLVLVFSLLSEQVTVKDTGLSVGYPSWCKWLLRRGWCLNWDEIRGLVPVGTSQGGTVYYFTTHDQHHHLLPQRLESFQDFLDLVEQHTKLDTSKIGRLTPPWTYQLLAGLAVSMLAGEATLSLAIGKGWLITPAAVSG